MGRESFRPLGIEDRETLDGIFAQDPPLISELTFTNLFMWRHRYRPQWLLKEDCLLIILHPEGSIPFGLPPTGPGDKDGALNNLSTELGKRTSDVRISRVAESYLGAFVDPSRYTASYDRDNSDYVYLTRDLIELSGKKYHGQKNHVNRFKKTRSFEYRPLSEGLVQGFLDMQESWCQIRECRRDPGLLAEDYAVYEALTRYSDLKYRGGAVLIDGKVEAFSLGEPLNQDTEVIHIEKANPDLKGLYAVINQLCCERAWGDMTFVNREQDLGLEGLRRAKESYHPHHMVNKYTLTPI